MVKVKVNDGEIYLDGYLKENLDLVSKRVHKDWDCVAICTGQEGDGKTTLAAECCYYLDPKFKLDNVVFNAEQFEELVDKAEPYSAVLWDECDELGGHWANRMLMAIKRKFMRIRSKNLFIFLVTPSLFHLNMYFVMHRPLFLLQVYSDKMERGFFNFYSRNGLQALYIHGKKAWNMKAWNPDFYGRFTQWPDGFSLNKGEYNFKKNQAVKNMLAEADSYNKRIGQEKYKIYLNLKREYDVPDKTAAELLNVNKRTVFNWKRNPRFGLDAPSIAVGKEKNTTLNLDVLPPKNFSANKKGSDLL